MFIKGLDSRVFLAPMAGVTDMPFRKLCKEFGAGLIYTEMASSKAIEYKSEKTENIYSAHQWIDIDNLQTEEVQSLLKFSK